MTLVEVLAVVVLLGIIGSVVISGIFGKAEKAKAKTNLLKMEKIRADLNRFRLENNTYPSSLEELVRSGDMDEKDTKDVWNTPYSYRVEGNGRSYVLTTLGADGQTGGDGAKADVQVTP